MPGGLRPYTPIPMPPKKKPVISPAKLLEAIRDASVNDEKDIQQKTLKLAEEVGEVAQAVLIYEKAHGTAYKNKTITKNDLLEEVADVILVAYSIPYKMGIDIEKFNKVIQKKLNKWNKAIGKLTTKQ